MALTLQPSISHAAEEEDEDRRRGEGPGIGTVGARSKKMSEDAGE